MVKYALLEDILEIPDEVDLKLEDHNIVIVKGPKGSIKKDFSHARNIKIELEGKSKLKFTTNFPKHKTVALINTIKSLINNSIKGVIQGYTYKSKICYSHFPISVELRGNQLHIVNFNGENAARKVKILDGIEISVEEEDVFIQGIDNQIVGQMAANIQRACKLRKKDRRVFQDGIYVYEKLLGDEVFWRIK
jgi:large subunit ribosomal protein L6